MLTHVVLFKLKDRSAASVAITQAKLESLAGIETLRGYSPLIDEDVLQVLEPEGSVAARSHPGGTAPAQVRANIAAHRQRLGTD